ncbi:MAG: hypothetical protein ACRD44_19450, partial [Bryobacteraceae bacterium]
MRRAVVASCVLALWLGAQTQSPRFERDVYPVLAKAGCQECHNPNGVASATRIHFPETAATAEQIAAFGASLVAV